MVQSVVVVGGGSVGDDDILIHAGRQRLQISVELPHYQVPSLGSSAGRAWDVDKRLKPELPQKII